MRSDFELMFEQLCERGYTFNITYPAGLNPLMQYTHPKDATEEESEWLLANKDRLRAYLVLREMPDVNHHLLAAYAQAVANGFYSDWPTKKSKKKKKVAAAT